MRVLLIAHKFSPHNSVGARRWTKFYKYMRRAGTDMTVLTQDWGAQQQQWGLDTTGDENIIRLSGFTDRLSSTRYLAGPVNFMKIAIGHKLLRFTDEGYAFNLKAYKQARKLITERGITHLIATSPPNSTAYFAAKLKEEFPQLVLIQDFRDAWMQAYETYKTGYGEQHPMYLKEQRMEHSAASAADVVMSVVPETVDYFKRYNTNTVLLTNGFDPEDYPAVNPAYPDKFLKKDKINICHFGTLDFGRETSFLKFIRASFTDVAFRDTLHIVLVGSVHEGLKHELAQYANIVFVPRLPQPEVEQLMFHTHIHLVVNDSVLYYAYGSKVFDAFLYRKPVLFITRPQSLSQFIHAQGLGIALDPDHVDAGALPLQINALLQAFAEDDFLNYYSRQTEPYNLQTITKQLSDVIRSKNNP